MTSLETCRLFLRPFKKTDFAAYRNIILKPEVVRYLPNEADPSAAIMFAEEAVTNWGKSAWHNGYAPWAVICKETNILIGHAGLRFSSFYKAPEIIYLLDSVIWGNGYAVEAVKAICSYARDEIGLSYLMAVALKENFASISIMKNCGLKFEESLSYDDFNLVRYGMKL